MSLRGLRIHIAGSAASDADRDLLEGAHEFVSVLSERLIGAGAGLVLGVGDEPLGDEGLPCTFDWTVLDVIARTPDPGTGWPADQPGRFRVVASQRALEKIPDSREAIWSECTGRIDFELEALRPGWRMGGVLRTAQMLRGDVLVVLGGGAGVEQLADELYSDEGKRVVPIRCDLGAISGDGNGGGSYLHSGALSNPRAFFELREGTPSATARLAALQIRTADEAATVAVAVESLIADLKPPRAFYVRLLSRELNEFESVEAFFRRVVDPVVIAKGFTPHEVGRDRPLAAFMNTEIFEGLHRAALVVTDLTGVRPNCTMELGYALARRRRVIISAMDGTRLPFDSDKLPTHFWSPDQASCAREEAFRTWLERHLDMPPIVQ